MLVERQFSALWLAHQLFEGQQPATPIGFASFGLENLGRSWRCDGVGGETWTASQAFQLLLPRIGEGEVVRRGIPQRAALVEMVVRDNVELDEQGVAGERRVDSLRIHEGLVRKRDDPDTRGQASCNALGS